MLLVFNFDLFWWLIFVHVFLVICGKRLALLLPNFVCADVYMLCGLLEFDVWGCLLQLWVSRDFGWYWLIDYCVSYLVYVLLLGFEFVAWVICLILGWMNCLFWKLALCTLVDFVYLVLYLLFVCLNMFAF